MKKIALAVTALVLVVSGGIFSACGSGDVYPAGITSQEGTQSSVSQGDDSTLPTESSSATVPPAKAPVLDTALGAEIEDYTVGTYTTESGEIVQNPVVTFEIENGGSIVVELLPEYAPNTVKNFVELVNSGYYDGVVFHRIVPGFMIQGGDPTGTGMGGPGYSIEGEFTGNGFEQNTLSHTPGIISMARSGDPNSAGSQFFITDGDATFLDGQYAAFGKVVSGMELVNAIAQESAQNEMAVYPRKMVKVTVDTGDYTWEAPKKITEK